MKDKDPKKPAPLPPAKAPAKPRGLSMEELRIKKSIAASPMFRGVSGQAPSLPEILAPVLDAFDVEVEPVSAEVSNEELVERLEAELLDLHRVPKAPGAMIAETDLAVIDTVGYCNGALLPLSVNEAMPLSITPDSPLPDLGAQLIGKEIGKTHQLEAPVPASCPDPSLRGKRAVYAVHVHGAFTIPEIKEPTPEILKRLGKGDTLEEVLETLAEEILAERQESARLHENSVVLNAMLTRVKSDVPEGLIDHEIGRQWREGEGNFLLRLDVPAEDRDRSLQRQLEDPELRAEVRRRLAVTQAVRSVALSLNLTLSVEEFRAYTLNRAEEFGLSLEELGVELEADEQARTELYSLAMYERTITLIVSKARITAPE